MSRSLRLDLNVSYLNLYVSISMSQSRHLSLSLPLLSRHLSLSLYLSISSLALALSLSLSFSLSPPFSTLALSRCLSALFVCFPLSLFISFFMSQSISISVYIYIYVCLSLSLPDSPDSSSRQEHPILQLLEQAPGLCNEGREVLSKDVVDVLAALLSAHQAWEKRQKTGAGGSDLLLKFRRVTIRGAQPSARLSEEICLSEGSAGVLSEGSAGLFGVLRGSAGFCEAFGG